ncbi:MAG: hypothetical protein PVJ57_06150 [Phycisphaerae bacterium]|jgi:hypothetical protein
MERYEFNPKKCYITSAWVERAVAESAAQEIAALDGLIRFEELDSEDKMVRRRWLAWLPSGGLGVCLGWNEARKQWFASVWADPPNPEMIAAADGLADRLAAEGSERLRGRTRE